jgi:hypothetical protein
MYMCNNIMTIYSLVNAPILENVGHSYRLEHQVLKFMSKALKPPHILASMIQKPWLYPEPPTLAPIEFDKHQAFCQNLTNDRVLLRSLQVCLVKFKY